MTARTSRLLVVEDDAGLRHTLVEQLGLDDDLEVVSVSTAAAAREAVKDDRIDLVLMEAGLPDMSGHEAASLIRGDGFRGAIVMLTGESVEPEIDGDASADDYIAKPFKFAALFARIRAQLRLQEASEDASLRIGPYLFRPDAKALLDDNGLRLRLTEKETAILRFLHRAGEAVVSREVLLQEVWGYNPAVTTHTLETHVYRLRQKIEPDPSAACILITEPGGYRLMP